MSVAYPIPRGTREALLVAVPGQTVFGPIDFLLYDAADLTIQAKAPGSDYYAVIPRTAYVVAPAPPATSFPAKFNITFATPQPAGAMLHIRGMRVPSRSTDVARGGVLQSQSLERELDKQVATGQELRRDIDRVGDKIDGVDAAAAHADAALQQIIIDAAAVQLARDVAIAAAGQSILTFPTRNAIAGVAFPAGIKAVNTLGIAASGDSIPASYYRVATPPAHSAKIRAADRYTDDGVTLDPVNGGWFALDVRGGVTHLGWFFVGDFDSAFAAAIVCAEATDTALALPAGEFVSNGAAFTVSKYGIKIRGAGPRSTTIYVVGGTDPFITFYKPGDVHGIANCEFSELTLVGGLTAPRIALRIVNTTEFVSDNVFIFNWTDAGHTSIALLCQGRELIEIRKPLYVADAPIVIDKNPMRDTVIKLDCDHLHVSDATLITVKPDGPVIAKFDGANISTVTFDGRQAWVSGGHGFYAVDTQADSDNSQLHFANVRREGAAPGFTMFFIDYSGASTPLRKFSVVNTHCGNAGSFALFGVQDVAIVSHHHQEPGQPGIVADETVNEISMVGCRWEPGTTASLTGILPRKGMNLRRGGRQTRLPLAALPATGTLVSAAMPAATAEWRGAQPDGYQRIDWTETYDLPVGVPGIEIPVFGEETLYSARITVHCDGREGGTVYFSPSGVSLSADHTANFAVTGNDGRLSIIYNSPYSVTLVNRLSTSVRVNVDVSGIALPP